jgi:hypothetical protein
MQQLYDPVLPGFYIAWAKRNEIAFPADLEAAVVARGEQIGDWKSRHDELRSRFDAMAASNEELREGVRNYQATIAELESKLNAAPAAERGLLGKERESVLRLIIGMAVGGYRYDPNATRSKVVADITSDLTNAGVELTDDTVRKWLREAAELLPPPEPE